MKEEKYLFPVLIIVICIGTLLFLNFPSPKITPKVNPLIELYKDSISDMRKQAKLDSEVKNLKQDVETLYIYSKIKQNDQKNDTTNSLVLIRFDKLLSINRANKRGKLVPSTEH